MPVSHVSHPKDSRFVTLLTRLNQLTQKIAELQVAQAANTTYNQIKVAAILHGQQDKFAELENKLKASLEKLPQIEETLKKAAP